MKIEGLKNKKSTYQPWALFDPTVNSESVSFSADLYHRLLILYRGREPNIESTTLFPDKSRMKFKSFFVIRIMFVNDYNEYSSVLAYLTLLKKQW